MKNTKRQIKTKLNKLKHILRIMKNMMAKNQNKQKKKPKGMEKRKQAGKDFKRRGEGGGKKKNEKLTERK